MVMDASQKLPGEEVVASKQSEGCDSEVVGFTPAVPLPAQWADRPLPAPESEAEECASPPVHSSPMPEPHPVVPTPIIVAAPPAASRHSEEWPKLEEFRQTHPLVKGVGMVAAAPIIVAGAVLVAFGTACYGVGEILVGIGDVVTGGPLKKTIASKVSRRMRAWRSRQNA